MANSLRQREAEAYAEARMAPATMKAIGQELDVKIAEKKKQLFIEKAKVAGVKAYSKFKKFAGARLTKPKKILRATPKATVVLNQPVYTKDENRFFTHAIDSERRQLFFK